MIEFVTDLKNHLPESSYIFLKKLIELSSQRITTNQIMIDVGANEGIVTDMMVACADQVIAIDAHPDWLNHFKFVDHPIVTAHNVACYSKNTQKKFIAESQLTELGFIGLSPLPGHLNIKNLRQFTVNCVTLDSLIQIKNNSRISFIKIDAESADFEIILGAEQLISIHRPWMFFEFSGQIFEKAHGHTRHDFFDFFTKHNYTLRSAGLGKNEEEIRNSWDIYSEELRDLIAVPTEDIHVLYT
jgi:FkbM family methyltransferase